MQIPLTIINAFTQRPFGGNPAAVCPLKSWLPDSVLLAIADQHNLAETAFTVPLPEPGAYELRWFTPKVEVPLCGHATLAAAWVLFEEQAARTGLRFHSMSGWLEVTRTGELLTLDFPARRIIGPASPAEAALFPGAGEVFLDSANNLLVVYERESQVRALHPNLDALQALPCDAVIVTAPGESVDFVSRFFAPSLGVPEDPVTGSAHCGLTPFWAARLGRNELTARQVSARGGELWLRLEGSRVLISGHARRYARGSIELDPIT